MQNSKKAWIAQRGNKDDGVRVYTAWCWWLDYLSLRRCKWHHRVIQGMRGRTESARLRKAYTTWSASSSFRRLRAHHCLSVVRGLSSRTVRSRQRYIVSRWKAHAHFVSFEEHPHTKSAPLEAQETREAHAHETRTSGASSRQSARCGRQSFTVIFCDPNPSKIMHTRADPERFERRVRLFIMHRFVY